jgi:predicted nucleic acid-binding Zn ribbon protein
MVDAGEQRRSVRRLKPRSRPQMLGELLDGARVVSAERGGVAIDRDTWRRLVGDRVARRTEPGGLSGGVLTIYVASAPWAQELSLLTNELLERLKTLKLTIASVRFRVRQQIQSSTAQAKRRPAARATLPSELRTRVESIEDPELRQVIADAAELWLGRQAKLSVKSGAPAPRSAAARSAPSAKSSPTRPSSSPRTPGSHRSRRR